MLPKTWDTKRIEAKKSEKYITRNLGNTSVLKFFLIEFFMIIFDSNWHSDVLIDLLHICLSSSYLFMMTGHVGTINDESNFPIITFEFFYYPQYTKAKVTLVATYWWS